MRRRVGGLWVIVFSSISLGTPAMTYIRVSGLRPEFSQVSNIEINIHIINNISRMHSSQLKSSTDNW